MIDWPAQYRAALPARLRPDPDDQRFLTAAWHARKRGWAAADAAAQVARRNYQNARNPVVLALIALEHLLHETQPGSPYGCLACRTATCLDPVREVLPEQWVRERFALLHELAATPDLTDDEREDAMATLIRDQRRRLNQV